MLTVQAPAKINLTLEVIGKRADGFHEISSVLQTVSLCDNLRFETGNGITLRCNLTDWSAERSLVGKAVGLLQEVSRCPEGAEIEVEKRIPLVSGLGGDSSDAAAVLRGLNKLWDLNMPMEELLGMAAELGSDVPFFLYGGTALGLGRGEKLTPLPSLSPVWVVLVMPDVPVLPQKTKQMYTSLNPGHYTDGHITGRLVKSLSDGEEIKSSHMFNTFENVAFDLFPGLAVYKEHIIKLGAPHVHLAGSGPALFTIIKDYKRANDLYTRCKDQGMQTYLAETFACYEKP